MDLRIDFDIQSTEYPEVEQMLEYDTDREKTQEIRLKKDQFDFLLLSYLRSILKTAFTAEHGLD